VGPLSLQSGPTPRGRPVSYSRSRRCPPPSPGALAPVVSTVYFMRHRGHVTTPLCRLRRQPTPSACLPPRTDKRRPALRRSFTRSLPSSSPPAARLPFARRHRELCSRRHCLLSTPSRRELDHAAPSSLSLEPPPRRSAPSPTTCHRVARLDRSRAARRPRALRRGLLGRFQPWAGPSQ
jgi:hypothetical protein